MKAAPLRSFGDPSVLNIEEVSVPHVSSKNVLVEIYGTAIDRMELSARKGAFLKLQLPRILGGDFSGVIRAVGDEVQDFRVGDYVVCYPNIYCEQCNECVRGNIHLCKNKKWVGIDCDGGYAEFVSLPSKCIVKLPVGVPLVDASTLPMAYTTAWHALKTLAKVQKNDVVVISGATGGVGTAVVHIALQQGAKVVAVASTFSKLQRLPEEGVIQVAYFEDDIESQLKSKIEHQSVDVVIDLIGGQTWGWFNQYLKNRGKYVAVGVFTNPEIQVNLRDLLSTEIQLTGSYFGTKEELQCVLELVSQGQLPTLTDQYFTLSEVAYAHEKMEKRENVGRYVLKIKEDDSKKWYPLF